MRDCVGGQEIDYPRVEASEVEVQNNIENTRSVIDSRESIKKNMTLFSTLPLWPLSHL